MKIERNVGRLDATLRLGLAIAFFAISLAYNASPAISLLAALAALLMAGTALSGRCPAYSLFRINTVPRGSVSKHPGPAVKP
jgi:hypothetical protein